MELKNRAFTLIEILLVISALAVLVGVLVIAINPAYQLAAVRNSQRYADVNSINKAIYNYYIDQGFLPTTVSTTPREICRTGAVDCAGLVDLSVLTDNSTYLVSIPLDPQSRLINSTGYVIYKTEWGRPVVYSPLAELDKKIATNNYSEDSPFVCGHDFIDYNSYSYSTVKIGGQCWFKENLRTTQYNDGSSILNSIINLDWQNNVTGSYSWYNNNYDLYGSVYGALYNFHAINTGKLCPSGWRVPTDNDFKILIESQSTPSCESSTGWQCSPAGDSLKESGSNHWNSLNTGNNISGFSALGGGYRDVNGSFFNRGTFAHFWSSSVNGANAWDRFLSSGYQSIYRNSFGKSGGFSVRCLKN